MPMLTCALFAVLVALSIRHHPGDVARRWLFVFLVAASLLYAGHSAFFNRDLAYLPVTDTIYVTCNLAVFPLYYIYIVQLTAIPHPGRWLYWLLLPALLIGVAVGTLYVAMSPDETGHFIRGYLYGEFASQGLHGRADVQATVHTIGKIVFAVEVPLVFFFGWKSVRRFDDMVRSCYADTEWRLLVPLHIILTLLIVTSLFSFLFNLYGRHHFASSELLLAIPSILFTVLLFSLAYFGYMQDFNYAQLCAEIEEIKDKVKEEEHAAPSQSVNRPKGIRELRERIEYMMSEEKLYLRSDLKISDLAVALNSNRKYIHFAINVEMGISFAEYINRQRIDYAVQLLKDRPELQMNEVAALSGYTSLSSFYRNFRLYKHSSPKGYKE